MNKLCPYLTSESCLMMGSYLRSVHVPWGSFKKTGLTPVVNRSLNAEGSFVEWLCKKGCDSNHGPRHGYTTRCPAEAAKGRNQGLDEVQQYFLRPQAQLHMEVSSSSWGFPFIAGFWWRLPFETDDISSGTPMTKRKPPDANSRHRTPISSSFPKIIMSRPRDDPVKAMLAAGVQVMQRPIVQSLRIDRFLRIWW